MVDMGGNNIVVTSVGSPPNASDLARGRRPGNFADFQDFLRLSGQLNVCQVIGGYPVEPLRCADPYPPFESHPSYHHMSFETDHCRRVH